MKVLIISDSHGNSDILNKIKLRHKDDVTTFIHCGDSELKKESNEMEHFLAVRGNCDFDASFPEVIVENIGDTTFLITHGHLHQVKTTLMPLKYKAQEMGANVVCFGHSHVAGAEMVDNLLFINPGSILLPRMTTNKTYVILDILADRYIVHYYNDSGELLEEHQFKR